VGFLGGLLEIVGFFIWQSISRENLCWEPFFSLEPSSTKDLAEPLNPSSPGSEKKARKICEEREY
jgi:hypothetical protein